MAGLCRQGTRADAPGPIRRCAGRFHRGGHALPPNPLPRGNPGRDDLQSGGPSIDPDGGGRTAGRGPQASRACVSLLLPHVQSPARQGAAHRQAGAEGRLRRPAAAEQPRMERHATGKGPRTGQPLARQAQLPSNPTWGLPCTTRRGWAGGDFLKEYNKNPDATVEPETLGLYDRAIALAAAKAWPKTVELYAHAALAYARAVQGKRDPSARECITRAREMGASLGQLREDLFLKRLFSKDFDASLRRLKVQDPPVLSEVDAHLVDPLRATLP